MHSASCREVFGSLRRHENICSMETHRSSDPRDRAIGAALQDAAALAAMVSDELTTSYRGSRRDLYLRTLRAYVLDLGGRW